MDLRKMSHADAVQNLSTCGDELVLKVMTSTSLLDISDTQENRNSILMSFVSLLSYLDIANKKLADSNPVIIPYKVINSLLITLYGIITMCTGYNW